VVPGPFLKNEAVPAIDDRTRVCSAGVWLRRCTAITSHVIAVLTPGGGREPRPGSPKIFRNILSARWLNRLHERKVEIYQTSLYRGAETMDQSALVKEALPEFFRNVEIIGSATVEVTKYRALHAETLNTYLAANKKTDVEIKANATPVLLASKSVKEAYQRNDFAQIRAMEDIAQRELEAVYNNVSTKGDAAWTKVRGKNGQEFYMSWSSTGSMWSYTESITAVAKNDQSGAMTFQSVVQVGTYTKTGRIAGIQTYNLNAPTLLAESVVAYLVARAVSGIIAEGLGFLVAQFAMFMANAAANLGLDGFAFFVSEAALATVASLLVFAIVFIGLVYLFDWLNRRYTIRLQIFNWDAKSDWDVAGQYMSNAKIPGGDSKLEFRIPKLVPPGTIVVPPGFEPVEALDAVCSYAVIIWENDNTFAEGCSMAVRIKRAGKEEGFMWAFDCPRFSDNKQAGSDGLKDPKAYRNSAPWSSSPLGFWITSTPSNVPVTFAVNALSGAKENLYDPIINVNYKK
jgi:hypothetical protein